MFEQLPSITHGALFWNCVQSCRCKENIIFFCKNVELQHPDMDVELWWLCIQIPALKINLQQPHHFTILRDKQLTWILCFCVLEVGSIGCFKWKHRKLVYLRLCHLLQAKLKEILAYLNDFR